MQEQGARLPEPSDKAATQSLYREATGPSEVSLLSGQGAIAFGPFRLLVRERRLIRDERPISLGDRAFDLLCALTSRAGTTVGKEELLRSLWPGTAVDESNLRVQIAALRKALEGGAGGERYIITVPGRGYCFVAPVDAVQESNAPLHNLPPIPAGMVGFEQIIDAVALEMEGNRLVSIVGPGGAGKTSLAIAVGH